ncbi:hypothetical protein HDE76_004084 [Rhodanobacter sp. ANJX3]|nr:hypothetical protein [Rhodanobacter sp. ANJX3]NYE30211.1 hypothetical protein [Rhodanobacter sp. K2T2]
MAQFMAQYASEAKFHLALFTRAGRRGITVRRVPAGCLLDSERGAVVLPVSGVLASNDAAEMRRVRVYQAAADDRVPPDPSAASTSMAALEMKRHLGMSYRTAWRLKHKAMEAMMHREEPCQLNGFVQIDDACLGAEHDGGRSGRGSENKQAFVIAIKTDANLDHPTLALIEPVCTFDNSAITGWAQRRLAPEAEAFSDGLGAFRRFETTGHAHTVLKSEGGRTAPEIDDTCWVNVLLSNLKCSIEGTYHAFKHHKYVCRYLAEAACRLNRLFRLPEFVPRRLRAMVLCMPTPEPLLR